MFENIFYFFFGRFIDMYYQKKARKLVDNKYYLEDEAMSQLEKARKLLAVIVAPKTVQDELAKKYGEKLVSYLPTSLRYEYLEKYEANKASHCEHFTHRAPTADPMQRYARSQTRTASSRPSSASEVQRMQDNTNMHIATQTALQDDNYMGTHRHQCSGRTDVSFPFSWGTHHHQNSGSGNVSESSSGSDSSTGSCD